MIGTFGQVAIGEEFTMNDQRFIKIDMVFTEGSCCVPSHNAHWVGDESFKVCIPTQTTVTRDDKNGTV